MLIELSNQKRVQKLAEHFGLHADTSDKIIQRRNIHNNNWENTKDTISFWREVAHYKDAEIDNL